MQLLCGPESPFVSCLCRSLISPAGRGPAVGSPQSQAAAPWTLTDWRAFICSGDDTQGAGVGPQECHQSP